MEVYAAGGQAIHLPLGGDHALVMILGEVLAQVGGWPRGHRALPARLGHACWRGPASPRGAAGLAAQAGSSRPRGSPVRAPLLHSAQRASPHA
jgi:hypothetical protein